MRMGKLILPRWGVLGREARDTARPSAAETPCSPRRCVHARARVRPFSACTLCRTCYHRERQQDGRIRSASQPTSSDSKSSLSPTFKPTRTPFAAWLDSSCNDDGHNFVALEFSSSRAALLGY